MKKIALFWALLLAVAAPACGQSLTSGPTPAPASSGIKQVGQYMTAPVTLDAAKLFTIASPASPGPGQVPIAQRQASVENALATLITVVKSGTHTSTLYSPQSLRVLQKTAGDQVVLQAVDATHAAPLSIVTVTPVDAKYYGTTVTSLAQQWQPVLQDQLRQSLLVRQPAVQQRNRAIVAVAGAVLVLVTLLLWIGIVAPFRRRVAQIEARAREQGEKLAEAQEAPGADQSATHQRRRHFLALALRAKDPKREAAALRAVNAVVIWLLLLLWFAGVVWAFLLFPQTTPFARDVVHTVATVLGIWIGIGLLNRILDLVVARIGAAMRRRHYRSSEERTRELLRIPTITAAISGFKTFLLIFIALLLTLSAIGIPVWSVVTFGGLTAIGLTLAAQNFVRDFFNGFLVLFEDQYVVGDFITINGQSGIVEELTLRMAQLRDTAGNLITIPHSTVTTVINHSRNWSRVDYRVSIDPAADPHKAMDAIVSAIHDVAAQASWKGVVLEPVEWIGVDAISNAGTVIRTSIKTAPLRQFELRRAVNERVQARLKEAGIALGAPVAQDTY